MYNFDEIINRRNTNCMKWDTFADEDLLPMWVADMDFRCPPQVITALSQRVEHGIFGYAGGYQSYYQAICDWMKNRHQWEIKQEWICSSPGVVPALNILVKGLTHPGDKVIIQPPVYHQLFTAVRNNGCHVVENPLQLNGQRYVMDFEDLRQKLRSGAKLLFLCSPHNPVTRVWEREELIHLGELCLEYDVLVIADEIHADLIFPGEQHTVFANIGHDFQQSCVVCNAPSKTFNIAGIQAANVIIPNNKIRKQFQKALRSCGLGLPNVFAITALEAAYNYGAEWLDELLVYIKKNYDFLQSFIEDKIPEVKVIESEGTHLAWLDFRALGLTDKQIEDMLINKARVVLSPGHMLGSGGEGFQRINIACPLSMLETALHRIYRVYHGDGSSDI